MARLRPPRSSEDDVKFYSSQILNVYWLLPLSLHISRRQSSVFTFLCFSFIFIFVKWIFFFPYNIYEQRHHYHEIGFNVEYFFKPVIFVYSFPFHSIKNYAIFLLAGGKCINGNLLFCEAMFYCQKMILMSYKRRDWTLPIFTSVYHYQPHYFHWK